MVVYTIGHSTRSWESFLQLLRRYAIQTVVDVRSYPGSKAFPQFNKDALRERLAEAGIIYLHFPQLGGRRKPSGSHENDAWIDAAFRGYADYALTPEFQQGLADLLRVEGVHAIMCAEAVPWRCHRRIIADQLVAQGVSVSDIISEDHAEPHQLTSFAKIDEEGRVTYPSEQQRLE